MKSSPLSPGAGSLCSNCGLCCNGVLFKDVELQPGDDVSELRVLGIPVSVSRACARVSRFPQPCAALTGCLCRIYPNRPARCRVFECALLKAVGSGKIGSEAALRTIGAAQRQAKKVIGLLRELGDADEHLALSLRFKRTKKRFESALAGDEAIETFSRLTLAVHDLNLLLRDRFYPGEGEEGSFGRTMHEAACTKAGPAAV